MLPEVGQEIYLQVDDGDQTDTSYKSKVIDVKDDYLSIYLPVLQKTGKSKVLRAGSRVGVSHFGKDGARYEYSVMILENVNDEIPYTRISMPKKEEIQRKQRRNFVRIPASVEVALELIEPNDRNIHIVTRTVDISGGGIAVQVPSTYDVRQDDQFNVWLVLPCGKNIVHANFIGRVTRLIEKENQAFKIAPIEIINISQKDQQHIVQFCFQCEVEQRKKQQRMFDRR
ncbi:MAG: flagellar brake domain-containing protein [Bacillaceae bacterium]|nr:flagellar brake domain-containing protein [Bacillaceae bacterium]